jgi:basic amino acid/polyamine antiporter, APA family
MFLCAKIASAATAALGFAGYLLHAPGWNANCWLSETAMATVIFLTLIVLTGIRRSSFTNIIIVSVTLLALGFFVVSGFPSVIGTEWLRCKCLREIAAFPLSIAKLAKSGQELEAQ